MEFQGLLKYQISFPFIIVSCENSKFLDFSLVWVKQFKKATAITWNSLKTQNSLSGEFWVLSYVLPHTYFAVTHGIMFEKTGSKVCASVYEAYQVLRMCLKY